MQWILKKSYYSVSNEAGSNNKWHCYFDIFLLIIYTTISIFNASIIFIPQSVKNFMKISQMGSVPSLSVLIINIIILLRINVKLCINREKNMSKELNKLQKSGIVVTEVCIPTWERRKFILGIGYVADAIIVLFCYFYGTVVIESYAWIVIISLIETFIDNFIEDSAIRFEAVPNVYIK